MYTSRFGMARNFKQLLYRALKKSTDEENVVADTTSDLLRSGYDACEVARALAELYREILDDTQQASVKEALEEADGWCKRVA